jgi:hypothetical protein
MSQNNSPQLDTKQAKFTLILSGVEEDVDVKKCVLMNPALSLSIVLYKFCESRGLDPTHFLLRDKNGNKVSITAKLGDVPGATVIMAKKKPEEIIEQMKRISAARKDKKGREDKKAGRGSDQRRNPLDNMSRDKLDEQIRVLNRLLQEKEGEIAKLKLQNADLMKTNDDLGKKDSYSKDSDCSGDETKLKDLSNITNLLDGRKRLESQWKRGFPSMDFTIQLLSMQTENMRLRNEVNTVTKDRKLAIMDCFSDDEITALFEHEVITRLLLSDVGSLTLTHSHLLTLTEFLKKGRYLEKEDQTFTHSVTDAFYKIYKRSANVTELLCFWLSQLINLADWVNKEYIVGGKISVYGLVISSNTSTSSCDTANSFWEAVYQMIIRYYRRLLKNITKALLPHCEPLIAKDDNTISIANVIQILSSYYQTFTQNSFYNIIILQFFNQVYRYMGTVLFNRLVCSDVIMGQKGLTIKLSLSELENWKYTNLRPHYPKEATSPPLISFKDLANLNIITQASKLVVLEKTIFSDLHFLKEQFPSLSYRQMYTILLKFHPDKYSPEEVSKDLMNKLFEQINNDDFVTLEENSIYSVFTV